MPPRFMERIQRQYAACESVFGQPSVDPPSYLSVRNSQRSSISSDSSGLAPSFVSRYHRRSQDLPLPPPPPPYCLGDQICAGVCDDFVLPKQSLILVTGANGWQSMHVVDQLLERGYRVRGTVRDAAKAIRTGKFFTEKYGAGRYMPVVIPDMVPKGAFDIAVRGCSGVVHMASVMSFSTDPHEVVTPTIAGALNALESAAQESCVKRFVYCSAVSAAVSECSDTIVDVTSESWNLAAFERAWDRGPPYESLEKAWAVFASSKMQAELAVWRWYRARKPQFVLNAVLPGTLMGEELDLGSQGSKGSIDQLKLMFDQQDAATAWAPPRIFVDVQDAALLHVAALTLPGVECQRIFAVENCHNPDSTLQSLRWRSSNPPIRGNSNDYTDRSTVFRDAPKAEALLRRLGRNGWKSVEHSIAKAHQANAEANQIAEGG